MLEWVLIALLVILSTFGVKSGDGGVSFVTI